MVSRDEAGAHWMNCILTEIEENLTDDVQGDHSRGSTIKSSEHAPQGNEKSCQAEKHVFLQGNTVNPVCEQNE